MCHMAPGSPRSAKRAVSEELADCKNTDFLFDARLLWGHHRYAKVSSICLERISSRRTWKTGNSFCRREPLKPSNGSRLFLALRV